VVPTVPLAGEAPPVPADGPSSSSAPMHQQPPPPVDSDPNS
jgi:hypothetical protein